ncbi:4-hydroxyphenylacetate 3-hydroxylase N-terminal domain-containing protein [Furfurilactobacillus curtus]|uniref:4-hydroxyphenylacetate 3-hydroxylase N-terminal domain-containing protein n=1 Tax=Furfurilactobacillus curtus TaxID=1746200 RepID=UPI0035EAD46C
MINPTDLDDGRTIYLDGRRVEKPSSVKLFTDTLTYVNAYYRLQQEQPTTHLYDDHGTPTDIVFKTPKTAADLAAKRRVYQEIASVAYGMLGRTPDFIDSGMATLAAHSEFLGHNQYTDFAANAKAYAERIKRDDVFVSHALQNPQIDRAQDLHEITQGAPGVHATEVTDEGIYVSGAKMVNTLAPLSNELLIFNTPSLVTGDDDYALAFWLPNNANGLKIVCRKPFNRPGHSTKDYPLSNAFDEIDAYIIFDHVFVPWTHVFVFQNVAMSNRFFIDSGLFQHTTHQDQSRGAVKFEFVTTLAIELAQKLGVDRYLNVQEMLGGLTANLELVRGALINSELTGKVDEAGLFGPNVQPLLAIRAQLPKMYQEAILTIQKIGAGSMMGVPDFRDFGGDLGETLRAVMGSHLMDAQTRAKLLNLGWDVTGESFGQRQLMYEYYHGGDPVRIRASHYQDEDLTNGRKMLADVMKKS